MLIIIKKYLTKEGLLIISLMVCLSFITAFNLALIFYVPPSNIEAKVNETSTKIQFWQNFLIVHPTYFEGWVELSNLHIENGDLINAQFAYQNAYKINPNSEKLILLKLKLDY